MAFRHYARHTSIRNTSLTRALQTRKQKLQELNRWFAEVKSQRISQKPGEPAVLTYHHHGKFISKETLKAKVQERKTLVNEMVDIQTKLNIRK